MAVKKKEEEIVQRPAFNQTIEKEQIYREYWVKFLDYETTRNQTIRFFNKNGESRNILDYVRDSIDRMNEFHEQPAYKEDWQSNVFDPITRNKLIGILSKIASSRMKPELLVKPRSIFNTKGTMERKMIFSDLLEAANRHNKDGLQLIWEMYTCMTQGTVIGYESWKKDTHTVEYIKEVDPDTGKTETEKIEVNAWDDVFGEIVPLNEWYPETIWVHDISQIKRCFRAERLTKEKFHDAYSKFGNFSKVNPAGMYAVDGLYDWGIPADINNDEYFVLHYYDEVKDAMCIWANGTELYNGPMPWNHKRLPFWMAIFEPINDKFIYGKSLPDKLMGMQDMNNGLLNAMLDQLFLGLNSPIFTTSDSDDITDGYLEPGRIYHGEEGSSMSKVNLGGVDPTAFNMLNLIKQGMEEASISAQANGVPSGGRKTKYETQQLQEGALNLASLFLQIMESCYSQKYWLRINNIIQYYSQPSSVKDDKLQFKFIILENRKLTNGKTGKKMIQISDNIPEDAKQQLTKIAEQESGEKFNPLESKIEPIIISRDWLINHEMDLEIKIIANSSVKDSEIDKINKDINFWNTTNQNPLFDQVKNAKDYAQAFGKDEDIVKEPMTQGEEDVLSGLPGVATGSNLKPGENKTELL